MFGQTCRQYSLLYQKEIRNVKPIFARHHFCKYKWTWTGRQSATLCQWSPHHTLYKLKRIRALQWAHSLTYRETSLWKCIEWKSAVLFSVMLRVAVESAAGLPKKKLGSPDPVVSVVFKGKKSCFVSCPLNCKIATPTVSFWHVGFRIILDEKKKTKSISNEVNPVWNEVCWFLFCCFKHFNTLNKWDYICSVTYKLNAKYF